MNFNSNPKYELQRYHGDIIVIYNDASIFQNFKFLRFEHVKNMGHNQNNSSESWVNFLDTVIRLYGI